MIYISHRGNIEGPNKSLENSKGYIEKAIKKGYDVEIDVWLIDEKYYLGHDQPQYEIDQEFLENPSLWCHAKNVEALKSMSDSKKIRYFWHQNDDVTLTSDNFIWTFPGKKLVEGSICVMPESVNLKPGNPKLNLCYGICSDFIKSFKEKK